MKRDLELIRKLLVAIKKHQTQFDLPLQREMLGFSEIDEDTFYQHVFLLEEAGLVFTKKIHNRHRDFWCPTKLSLSGTDFVEYIQIEKIWSKLLGLDSKVSTSMDLILMIPLTNLYFKNLNSLI